MSFKTNYLNILRKYNEQKSSINAHLNNVINGDTYSDEYKNDARNKAQEEIRQLKRNTSQQLIDILHTALNEHKMATTTTFKERLENFNYQTGINSLIASIQADAVNIDEWQNIGRIYLNDNVAIKRINKAIADTGSNLYPLEYKEDKTEQYLKKIENNVHTYIENHYGDDELAIVGMIDFIGKRLDDNMVYVNEQ